MKVALFIVLLVTWPAILVAQDTRAQIAAATDQAVESLRQQVWSLPAGPGMTVGRFIELSNSQQRLLDGLRSAGRVGGPRWLDNATCQVELELPASRVIQVLRLVALGDPPEAPATAEQIAQATGPWRNRVFRAVGTSVSAGALGDLRPRVESAAWRGVSDESRRSALRAAQQDAARRVLESVGGVSLTATQTVAGALAEKDRRQALLRWLEERPVTGVSFREDLEVEVAIAVQAAELGGEIARICGLALDERSQRQLAGALAAVMAWPVGRAAASRTTAESEPVGVVQLPAAAPEWARMPLDASGEAAAAETKLRAAMQAEQRAREALRRQVEALRLNGLTVGQAAEKDGSIARGMSRAIEEAKATRTEYRPDGAASVRVRLDGRTVWEQIRRER